MKLNLTLKKAIAEFLGVLMFVTSIVASISSQRPLPQLALAITLGLAILITAAISGGHLNPAVSLFFYARREISLGDLAVYLVAQIAGGFAGASIGALLWDKTLTGFSANSMPAWSTIGGELFATGGLVFLIGFLATNKRAALIPAAVALWVFAAATFTQTGAQANPAVSLGLTIAGQGTTSTAWFILAQLAGALIATGFLIVFNAKAVKPAKKKAKK
jgi:arsenate reductase